MLSAKETLVLYLQAARAAVVEKLDGLSEREQRMPLTPTGTNLLGLVKHLASVEFEYFGVVFGRPGEPVPWDEPDSDPNADLWATADESAASVREFYLRSWVHADATIATLDLDAVGRVPWWAPAKAEVTLHRILVHVIAETNRHAGHADIVRELTDGAAGLRKDNSNMPDMTPEDWAAHVRRLERIADEA